MNGQEEQRGVRVLVPIRGHEMMPLRVEPVREDVLSHLLRGARPARAHRVVPEERRQIGAAPKREPAHQLGVDVVPLAVTRLPDPVVGLPPKRARVVHHTAERAPRPECDRAARVFVDVGRIQERSRDVVLDL